jgi:hypothetical protein
MQIGSTRVKAAIVEMVFVLDDFWKKMYQFHPIFRQEIVFLGYSCVEIAVILFYKQSL